jgi:glucose/arabinose dehydrogenase
MRCRLAVLLALLAGATAHADSLSGSGSPSPASLFTIQSDFVTGVGLVTDFRWLPDGRLVVINKTGDVMVRPAGGGTLVAAGSFDVDTNSEKGLLGIAVDPNFTANRRLYFYYSASGGSSSDKHRVVARTLRTADSMLDAGETVLLSGLRGPANHDGGGIDIGPDGLLYVGVGDTGCNSGLPPEPIYTPTNFYGTCLADDGSNHGGGNG